MGLFPSSYAEEFRLQNEGFYWATIIAILLILIWHFSRKLCFSRSSAYGSLKSSNISSVSGSVDCQSGIPEIVSDRDLKFLIENLDGNPNENEKWETVIDKRNSVLWYNAKCCKPKDAPLKYLSVTVFENCSAEVLRDFYMDNDYRKQWDKTLVLHEQLHMDRINGIEIGRTIKKFPLLTPREYVLAWRLWEGKDNTFYCFIKECEHPLAPLQRKFVRVGYFRSGWRIRKVPGTNACEIKMFHQEDAGLNVEMAKLAFAKGIWSYVCKMDNALRKYPAINIPQTSPAVSAVTLIKEVPLELDVSSTSNPGPTTAVPGLLATEAEGKKFLRKPSRKFLANSLLLLGGAVCLSRGHSSLGAKVAMAYFLTKLGKHRASSSQNRES